MEQSLLDELKLSLEKEKNNLTQELRGIAAPDKNVKGDWDAKYENLGDSWDENAQEVTEYATRVPLEHELEIRLQQVELALKKIDDSTYGICEVCKSVMDENRLKANPAAATCVQHAQ
ncbi:MAG: hypothetical protein AAB911_00790 [Patescibacteria group bacterium]